MTEKRTGWFWPPVNSRKAHYWTDWNAEPRSACGKFILLAELPAREFKDDCDGSPDNCAVCKRKVAKLRERRVVVTKGRAVGPTTVEDARAKRR